MECEAFGVEERGELAVGDAGIDRDSAGLGIERDDFVERLEGEEGVFAVGDVVEAVAGAEDFELGMVLDEGLGFVLGISRRRDSPCCIRGCRPSW